MVDTVPVASHGSPGIPDAGHPFWSGLARLMSDVDPSLDQDRRQLLHEAPPSGRELVPESQRTPGFASQVSRSTCPTPLARRIAESRGARMASCTRAVFLGIAALKAGLSFYDAITRSAMPLGAVDGPRHLKGHDGLDRRADRARQQLVMDAMRLMREVSVLSAAIMRSPLSPVAARGLHNAVFVPMDAMLAQVNTMLSDHGSWLPTGVQGAVNACADLSGSVKDLSARLSDVHSGRRPI